MKNILFILHLPPPIHGAAQVGKYIKESKLINNDFQSDYINLTTAYQLNEIGKNSKNKYLRTLNILISVFHLTSKKKYDLCYLTLTAKGAGFLKDLFVVLLLKITRQNIIYHFHNKGVADNKASNIKKILYRFVFKDTKIILLSPKLYFDIADFVKPKDVFYCANGIPEIKLIIKEKRITTCNLLFLSNMIEQKGIFILLEACKFLKKKNLLFNCHFVGAWSDVTEEGFNNTVYEYNLQDHVFVHGPKYGKEKQRFFQLADVFVLPTFYDNECFPLVLLEALQFNLPIVSTPEGGIPDIVIEGETGFLIPKKNSTALAKTLELLINDPHLGFKMGKKGRELYEKEFTLEQFE
ncbi:MAG: glycosyltransferase family 4 protein, partial [Nitrosopumilus sp.]|nr:glycosyltransferase family 4 protein [Nitrosopumilus sp.]